MSFPATVKIRSYQD